MTEREERLNRHVAVLIQMRNDLLDRDDWESHKPEIEAVTCGGMAIQRILREDFEKKKCCRDCKYLNGEKSSVGIACTNPNKAFRSRTAKFKQKATAACKMFEQKGD